ncbi:MAG: hypothetical protein K2M64_02405 [Clostridia bacterium]|nr:hypothetical protein [Clostridia bacterium]
MSKIESFEIEIPQLKRDRTVWVYLPDNYKQAGEPCPVIYMHDGQNLFYDKLTAYGAAWHVDKVMDEIYATTGKGAVIVGVESYDRARLSEYSPWNMSFTNSLFSKGIAKHNRGGEGKQYAEFFTKNLKNYVDSNYNVVKERDGTAIIGSSMGAFISCFIALSHQRLYETMGLFSISSQFNKGALDKFLNSGKQILPQYALVYCGGKEGDNKNGDKKMVANSLDLYKRLSNRGIHCELLYNSDYKHFETAWGVYFEKFARDFLNRYYKNGK